MKKQSILNWIITGILLIGLVACYFFWGCKLDLVVTIIAVVVAASSSVLLTLQNKRIKELTPTE